jgi:hypothetical protein
MSLMMIMGLVGSCEWVDRVHIIVLLLVAATATYTEIVIVRDLAYCIWENRRVGRCHWRNSIVWR